MVRDALLRSAPHHEDNLLRSSPRVISFGNRMESRALFQRDAMTMKAIDRSPGTPWPTGGRGLLFSPSFIIEFEDSRTIRAPLARRPDARRFGRLFAAHSRGLVLLIKLRRPGSQTSIPAPLPRQSWPDSRARSANAFVLETTTIPQGAFGPSFFARVSDLRASARGDVPRASHQCRVRLLWERLFFVVRTPLVCVGSRR